MVKLCKKTLLFTVQMMSWSWSSTFTLTAVPTTPIVFFTSAVIDSLVWLFSVYDDGHNTEGEQLFTRGHMQYLSHQVKYMNTLAPSQIIRGSFGKGFNWSVVCQCPGQAEA